MTEVIELPLDGIAHGGEAIGHAGGRVVFVPGAIPGERVHVELIEERARWARARLLDVLTPSPDRVDPPCPYFGLERCGGCQWQHIAYARQAELKGAILADQLLRLGRIEHPPVADVVVLADPAAAEQETCFLSYGYRNHVQFAVTGDARLGFRRAGSHEVIPINRCLLLHEHLDDLHRALDITWPSITGVTLRTGIATGDTLVLLETNGADQPELEIDLPAACALRNPTGIVPLVGEPYVHEEVAGLRYRIGAGSFFQVNSTGAAALVDTVTAYVEEEPADVLVDAYCGVGLFAMALATRCSEVIGIESSPSSCDDFAANAGSQANVTLHEGPVEQVLPALASQGVRADAVVLDPPRAGAGPEVIANLAALGPRRMIYVSCDPATLARDALHLKQAGYRLIEAQPIDLFPQTYHLETVALWQRM